MLGGGAAAIAWASTSIARTQERTHNPTVKEEIAKLRPFEDEFRSRWIADEEGWRKLPARAWPKYQPSNESVDSLGDLLTECKRQTPHSDECCFLEFSLATGLVFNSIDPERGLSIYRNLAKRGYTDAKVAAGVVLTGGLGVSRDETEGLNYLKRSVEDASPQGYYEMATLLFTGDVVEEDEKSAFDLFERAAELGHTGAEFMLADCLLEGAGCERDGARAVPLLYSAAEKGHRSARRRLLSMMDGRWCASSDGWCPTAEVAVK